jgi:hypothetical protein
MRVSSKIASGFLIVMALALAVLVYQLTVVNRMQRVNRDLSEINMNSATTALDMKKIAGLLSEDCKKYFAFDLDEVYDRQITDFHQDFLEDLAELSKTARSPSEHASTEKLAAAVDDYWRAFNRVKRLRPPVESDRLPPDLMIAMDHLEAQSEAAYDTVKVAMKDQVAQAA